MYLQTVHPVSVRPANRKGSFRVIVLQSNERCSSDARWPRKMPKSIKSNFCLGQLSRAQSSDLACCFPILCFPMNSKVGKRFNRKHLCYFSPYIDMNLFYLQLPRSLYGNYVEWSIGDLRLLLLFAHFRRWIKRLIYYRRKQTCSNCYHCSFLTQYLSWESL